MSSSFVNLPNTQRSNAKRARVLNIPFDDSDSPSEENSQKRYVGENSWIDGFEDISNTTGNTFLKPKGYVTAFNYFVQDHRKIISEENKNINNSELNRLLGEKWKNLESDLRERYFELSNKDKTRYIMEIEKYNSRIGCRNRVIPRINEPGQKRLVHRPLTSYNLFAHQEKLFIFGLENDLSKRSGMHFGHRWQRMDPEEKELYIALELCAVEKSKELNFNL